MLICCYVVFLDKYVDKSLLVICYVHGQTCDIVTSCSYASYVYALYSWIIILNIMFMDMYELMVSRK